MAYEPLHHKYRPQRFSELVGQEAIATTLTNALNSDRIAPAYLFNGPRGTGKTSSARILAKSLNCLNSDRPTPDPCGQCEVCEMIARGSALDVIEIDAASNTGVDNIRELIEKSQFAPVQCRYKVYVIDECHMLSTAAFNALLKTLEEPPPRVIFVLATTDPQKVLPTIISRCQRFDYRRIPLTSMVEHLTYIAQQEAIAIEQEAITLVAQISQGGLRDAESLLDQLSLLSGEVTIDRVWDLVGAVPEQDLLYLLQVIAQDQPETVIEQCRHLMDRGREPLIILQNLASFYVYLLLAKTAPDRPELAPLTSNTWQQLCTEAKHWSQELILRSQEHLKKSEVQIKNTTQPRLWLEITVLGLLPSAQPQSPGPITSNATKLGTTSLTSNVKSPRSLTGQAVPPQSKDLKVVNSAQPVVTPIAAVPVEPTPIAKPPESSPITKIYSASTYDDGANQGQWSWVVQKADLSLGENIETVKDSDSVRLELEAAIKALEFVHGQPHQSPIEVYSNSDYLIKGITEWVNNWKADNWILVNTPSKRAVPNRDLWQTLDRLNADFIQWHPIAITNAQWNEIVNQPQGEPSSPPPIPGQREPQPLTASTNSLPLSSSPVEP
ncbi:MAG: DNA polymerase III subunit gamma/tau, partial [Synechococcaceae cyanobacterium RL_1_2]|nr:DNA polymerase III subunit gamma/tau [Synechococcaceae cyanobacterium RL_1_2]